MGLGEYGLGESGTGGPQHSHSTLADRVAELYGEVPLVGWFGDTRLRFLNSTPHTSRLKLYLFVDLAQGRFALRPAPASCSRAICTLQLVDSEKRQ